MKLLRTLPLVFLAGLAGAAPPAALSDAPVKNFALKVFTQEGPLSLVARGSVARYRGPEVIDITDMNITFFSGDASSRVDTVLLSPQASFFPGTSLASGEQAVRFLSYRDNLEATGTRWSYDHKEKRISLDGNVRVVFHAELKNILK